uniref:Uncharacterized protein n=1 Tax=Arundo donax TaxID=35708 RepID=A0A0A9CB59_ARUDO
MLIGSFSCFLQNFHVSVLSITKRKHTPCYATNNQFPNGNQTVHTSNHP